MPNEFFLNSFIMAKIEIDIKKIEAVANKLRTISHPLRIAIITLLDNNGKMNVTEIYTKLKIEQATASHHLNILKNKGILVSTRVGKQTYYSLKKGILSQLNDCINKCGA